MKRLTKKEEVIMNHFWEKGPLFVRELRELYPDPKPHFSTLSREEYKQRSLVGLIDKYFDNSYINAVSARVKEEKISVDQLKELIDLIEKEN